MAEDHGQQGPWTQVPGYDFVRELHRGAQGVVVEAVQRATRRTVAVKLIADGVLAAPQAQARFQREVQILAGLRHPNIVAIHDSGAVAGCFYYVMEYVAGTTLDKFVDDTHPTIPQTIKLFTKLCDGINAAHLHGVIHRDLKPRNVLVNESGEPIVIDFGLAKPLTGDADGGAQRLVSQTGEFLGSLPWASPEQAEADPARIDIRSDVYSLGVLLFQLLTGRFPYAIDVGMRRVLENIAHAIPIPPRSLRPEVDEELETIVLTALRKELDRRYQSAGELAADLRRYLAGDPVAARGDSTIYVIRKKLRKHRVPVAAAIAVLVIGAAFSTALFVVRQRSRMAERRGADIQLAFMERALSALEPGNDHKPTAAELRPIADRVTTELAGYPTIQGPLLERIGNVFRRLGLLDAAKPYLEQALEVERGATGDSNAELASALFSLGGLYYDLGQFDDANKLYGEALALRRRTVGVGDARTAEVMNDYAGSLSGEGRFVEAEKLYREALAIRAKVLGEAHPDTAATRSNLASCLLETGKYGEAEALYRIALASVEDPAASDSLKGADRPQFVARGQTTLAAVLVEEGKLDEARHLLRESLATKDSLVGRDHPSTASTLSWLARLELAAGNLDAARTLAEEALAIRAAKLPPTHPRFAVSLEVLAEVLMAQGDFESARARLAQAGGIEAKSLAANHWRRANTQSLLGECLCRLARYEEAEPLLLESVSPIRETRGDGDRYTRLALSRLASLYEARGQNDKAAEYRARLAMGSERTQPLPPASTPPEKDRSAAQDGER